jgi:WD40 repeat protein
MNQSNHPSTTKLCPTCGAELSAAAGGLCPRCLMADAAAPTGASGKGPASAPPSQADVAAAFPQYEVFELIGTGGMGTVWRARQPSLDRHVALKLLPASLAGRDPAFAERFEREGRLLARLHHPNIVTVHDSGRAGDFFYLVMEFVDGVNLRQVMRASRFTSQQALAIVPRICDALQYAHDEGVLHRDIKPENILLDSKGRVKLVDFGIAKVMAQAEAAPAGAPVRAKASGTDSLTVGDSTLGTPNYMAPEQIAKPADVDHRADIYSLGVVFYELLTGELPKGKFAAPSECCASDPRLDDIVRQALEKERTRRQQSVAEVRTQVETVVGGEAAPAAAEEVRRPWRMAHVVLRDGKPVIRWPVVFNTLAFQFGIQTAMVLLIWVLWGRRFPLDYSLLLVLINALVIAGMELSRAWGAQGKSGPPARVPRLRLALQVMLAAVAAGVTVGLFFLLSHSASPAWAVNPSPAPPRGAAAPSAVVPVAVPDVPPRLLFHSDVKDRVSSVDYSPDGKYLAVGCVAGTVKVLDGKTGKPIREINLLDKEEEAIVTAAGRTRDHVEVRSVAFSPDSSVLAAGTSLGQAKLFDAATGVLKFSLDGVTKRGAAETANNKLVAMRLAMGHVWQIQFSADGTLLATGGEELRDIPDDGKDRGLSTYRYPLLCTQLKVWDAKTGALKRDLAATENQVTGIAFAPNGQWLASAGVGGRGEDGNVVKIWDLETGERKRVIPMPGGRLSGGSPLSLAVSPDGNLMAIGLMQYDKNTDVTSGSICVVHPASGITELVWPVARSLGQVEFLQGGRVIAAVSGNNALTFWDAQTGKPRRQFQATEATQGWGRFSFCEKEKAIAISGMDSQKGGFVEVWMIEEGPANPPKSEGGKPPGTTSPSASFGPVLERIVEEPSAPGYLWFDLDAGKAISAANAFADRKADQVEDEDARQWRIRNGVDVGAVFEAGRAGLGSLDPGLVSAPVKEDQWEQMTPAALEEVLRASPGEAAGMMTGEKLPATFVFKTRDGGRGLLQIIGFTGQPRGLKIRYKLLTPAKGARSPRETVAQFLRRIRADDVQPAWDLTTRGANVSWSAELTGAPEYERIQPLHQLESENQAMVVTNLFRAKNGLEVAHYSFLAKRDGEWLIDRNEFAKPNEIALLMKGFAANPAVKFNVIPAELVGEWHFPCASTVVWKADGSGAEMIVGPGGQEPGAKPETFRWEVNGSTLVRRFANREEKLEAAWIDRESYDFKDARGEHIHAWRSEPDEEKPEKPRVPLRTITERVLADYQSREMNAVDLETGQLFALPQVATKDAILGNIGERMTLAHSWFAETGVDLVGRTDGPAVGVTGFDLAFQKVADAQWDSPKADELGQMLADVKAEPPKLETLIRNDGAALSTFAFRTHHGSIGLLQILGAGEVGKTVKIRYQLLTTASTATTRSPREMVAEFLRMYKAGQYREAVALTTHSYDLGWNIASTDPAEFDRVRPLHQMSSADRAMVFTNVFHEISGAARVFHAFLIKRSGEWIIDSLEFSPAASVPLLMRGFAADPRVKFDIIPAELVGEWHALCQSALEMNADGTGFEMLFGPEQVQPGQKPKAFKWEVSGSTLLRHFADREQRLEALWITDEAISFKDSDGREAAHGYREEQPGGGPGELPPVPLNEIVERVLAEEPGANGLDLETGHTDTIPGSATKDATLGGLGVRLTLANGWITKRRLDLAGWMDSAAPGVIGFDLAFKKVEAGQWDAPKAEDLGPLLAGVKAETPSADRVIRNEGGATFAFRTREGGLGVLQVLGPGEKEKTVKVRYKMVQLARPSAPRGSN